MFLEKPDDEEDKKANAPTNEGGDMSVGGGGGNSELSTDGSAPSAPQGGPKAPDQTFATVQDYLKANQTQGEKFGQDFTNKVGADYTADKSAIDTAATTAKDQVQNGTVNEDTGLINTAKNNPTAVANDPNQLSSFLKQWNASYSGPASFEASDPYAGAAKAADDANTTATELGSEGGREQLVQDKFNVYGQGNKALDDALLSHSSALPTIQQALTPQFSSIKDYLASKAGDVNNAAQAATDATAKTKADTQAPFTNSLTDFQNDLNSRVSAARDAAGKTVDTYQADLASGDPDKVAADLKASGVDDSKISSIVDYLKSLNSDYGVKSDLSGYYSAAPNADINPANVATADDYARAAALQKLTGVNYSGVLDPANAPQAGTAPGAQPGKIDYTNLSDYLKNTLAGKDNERIAELTSPGVDLNNVATMGSFFNPSLSADQRAKYDQDLAAAVRQGKITPQQVDSYKQATNTLQTTGQQKLQALNSLIERLGPTANVHTPGYAQLVQQKTALQNAITNNDLSKLSFVQSYGVPTIDPHGNLQFTN